MYCQEQVLGLKDGEHAQVLKDGKQVQDLEDGEQVQGLKDGKQVQDLEDGEGAGEGGLKGVQGVNLSSPL